jgi:PIN domain nuclease of toxin-antitoxin system
MNLLLDTHVLIWFLNGDDQLQPAEKNRYQKLPTRALVALPVFGKWLLKAASTNRN